MSALHKKLTMANCISTSDSGDRTITEQSPSEQSLQASRDECRQWFSPSAYGEVHSVTEQSPSGQGLQADGDECRQWFSPSAYGEVHEEEPHVQSHVHVVGVASQ